MSHKPDDQRLKDNLFFYASASSQVTVVIPTKSNLEGLVKAVHDCMKSAKVKKIVVVGDGEKGWELTKYLPSSVVKVMVPEGSGIHTMWNLGMSLSDGHVLFLNDDVQLVEGAIDAMCSSLDREPSYGLVCPQYAKNELETDQLTETTCRGRYDGSGGIAGFCMMLSSDLSGLWRFDERMKWWYGDDDLVKWVVGRGRRAAIIADARCSHDHSRTVDNDPPPSFATLVNNDKLVYESKWGIGA